MTEVTKIKRTDLIRCLDQVAPALSSHGIVPILTHFWFTGKQLLAYNDQIAIAVPLRTNFKGALPGALMLSLLKSSRLVNLEISQPEDGIVQIRSGAEQERKRRIPGRMKLSMLDPESFQSLFKMPEPKGAYLKVGPLTKAIEACMLSVSTDTSVPDQLGITLIFKDKGVELYSTDRATISHAFVPLKTGKAEKFADKRVILSAQFCRQLLRLSKEYKEDVRLSLSKDYALLYGGWGSLYGSYIQTEDPLDFEGVLGRHADKAALRKLVPIPTKMNSIIDQACIVSASHVEAIKTKVEVFESEKTGDVKVRFVTKSPNGQVTDTMGIGEDHPLVSLVVNPKLIKAGYGQFDRILFRNDCVIMEAKNRLYLMSATE